MEGKARTRFIRISPRKLRRAVELVRGRGAEEALNLLHFTRKDAAGHIEKTLRSAVANAQFLHPAVETGSLVIKDIFVNGGPTLKRGRAGSMGRRSMIRKRTSHLTIVVSERA